ncbi:MAG: hypothetical protein J5829_09980 [Lachnospiraceae bacterium]|nr:hypothetical protein [Lachnospiraceae bacterium]
MERRLETLFDYQKFEKEPHLEAVIDDTHKRFDGNPADATELGEDELGLVSAAGEQNMNPLGRLGDTGNNGADGRSKK